MKTYSVAYREGQAFDESAYAAIVSRRFGTEHQVLYVDPARFQQFIPDYVWHMDEPVTEAAAISLYFISKQLKEQVTVALSGEGADELFAGYEIYRYMQWMERYRSIPEALRSQVLNRVLALAPSGRGKRFALLAESSLEQRYVGVPLLDTRRQQALYTDDFAAHAGAPSPLAPHWATTRDLDTLSRMLYVDLKGWLVDDLLIKADKMTMASSVELRVPFLDHRVVEFAATVPSWMKLRHGQVKWILKRAMAPHLPAQVVEREKVGFPTPLATMFRGELSEYVGDLLLSAQCTGRGYFTTTEVERLIREHKNGVTDHHKTLWQLIVLEEWHRRFIDQRSRPTDNSTDHMAPVAGSAQSHALSADVRSAR
jgi:asparagine synthase (glutamine-hydrolysing)